MLNAVVILAFTLPKAYELKKDEVDSFASQAHHHTKVALAHTIAHGSGRAFKPVTMHYAGSGCCNL